MISVALIDDQTLIRQGIRQLLALTADIRVIAEAGDGDEAVALLTSTPVNVVLLDVRMPKRSGLEVLAALKGSAPASIVLTTFDDDSVALQAIRLGARGFLLKDVSLDELAAAIRSVARGECLFQPSVTARVREGVQRHEGNFVSSELPDSLTARELDVLRLMAAGQSNREISEALGMAEGTAKNHASSILSKLGVRDRTRAVLRALDLGII